MSELINKIKKWTSKYMSMKFIEARFTDMVSGKQINLYRQTDGKVVLAESKFSFFRIEYERF